MDTPTRRLLRYLIEHPDGVPRGVALPKVGDGAYDTVAHAISEGWIEETMVRSEKGYPRRIVKATGKGGMALAEAVRPADDEQGAA